jgi:polysaccharide export outer membrane protein
MNDKLSGSNSMSNRSSSRTILPREVKPFPSHAPAEHKPASPFSMAQGKIGLASLIFLTLLACSAPTIPESFSTTYTHAPFYRLSPGDEVEIGINGPALREVIDKTEILSLQALRVDGYVSVPFVEDIRLAGLTVDEARNKIGERLMSRFAPREPLLVQLVLKNTNAQAIHVFGEMNAPGRYAFNGDLTLLDAVSLARGFNRRASHTVTLVRKPLKGFQAGLVVDVDLDEMMDDGDQSHNFYLHANDIIIARKSVAAHISDIISMVFSPIKGVVEGVGQIIFPAAFTEASTMAPGGMAGGAPGQ